MIISRDVEFDEEGIWDWQTQQEKEYDIFPVFGDDGDDEQAEDGPSQPSPPSNHSQGSSSFSSERPQRFRSIQEIYDNSEELSQNMNELTLFCLFADHAVISFDDAIHDEKWKKAMNEEIEAIKKNDTWQLTTLPHGQKPVGVKWIYKEKRNASGEIERYKARLVAKGYSQ